MSDARVWKQNKGILSCVLPKVSARALCNKRKMDLDEPMAYLAGLILCDNNLFVQCRVQG